MYTKADTLKYLKDKVSNATVLPQYTFKVTDYQHNLEEILKHLKTLGWMDIKLIVRSSCYDEDTIVNSMAGQYTSILNVKGKKAILSSIDKVIESYEENEKNQILIQPMIEDVYLSGVAFNADPNTGSDYYVINYDDLTKSTTSVTDGSTNDVKTIYHHRMFEYTKEDFIKQIICLFSELESLLEYSLIDIEFSIDNQGKLFLLQVRPLISNRKNDSNELGLIFKQMMDKFEQINCRHPYLYGESTIFGVMPDWNPAEIIGIRPKPLALSLYKEIITDNIWAYQRDNYGYRNLRSFPLLISFSGMPYIDVRVSFNSFLPKSLDETIAEKLVNYYVQRLKDNPSLHDKVEFDIIFSCYTLDLEQRITVLEKYGFNKRECKQIVESLRELTNNIIDKENGIWRNDLSKIEELDKRRNEILNSDMDEVSKVYWLLEDCKRYGTLPFAGLARAGFIAVQLLHSLVNINVLSISEYHTFMSGLNTVSTMMTNDYNHIDKDSFLYKYGHLRPGTYDILSPSYKDTPELYFDWSANLKEKKNKSTFSLSLNQLNQIDNLLAECKLNQDILGLFDFIKSGIEGREYSKFIFSKSLSAVLDLIKKIGLTFNLTADQIAFSNIEIFKYFYSNACDQNRILNHSIREGQKNFELMKKIQLPAIIKSKEEFWSFERLHSTPNYVTEHQVTGYTCNLKVSSEIDGKIVFIENADPGYDWIFSHSIGGLITKYGGINSHMAIRAGELGIPAIIGAGDLLYNKWSTSELLYIDCLNRKVNILK